MDVVDLRPDLRMLVAAPGQAYLMRRRAGVLLVDSGPPGHGAAIMAALRDWGEASELTHLVVTHAHADHTGSAAEVAALAPVRVLVHAADAAVVRGEVPEPAPVLTAAERDLHARVAGHLPAAPPVRVDAELSDGELLEEIGAVVVGTPGHTPGSIALHLPEEGVLFTGDTVAEHEGDLILGPFNADRAAATASARHLAALAGEFDLDAVCFGHGRPLLGAAAGRLRALADTVPDPLGE